MKRHICALFLCVITCGVCPAVALGQGPPGASDRGAVVSLTRATLVIRTAAGDYKLFELNGDTTKPLSIPTGSAVTVLSDPGDGTAPVARSVVVTAPPPQGLAPPQPEPVPASVRRLERSIERQSSRYHLGVRTGAALDPELVMLGAQMQLGPFLSDNFWARPSLDFGFGEVTDLVAINLEGLYRVPVTPRTGRYAFFFGAGPSFNFEKLGFDLNTGNEDEDVAFDEFNLDVGLNFMAGVQARNGLFFELKSTAYAAPGFRFVLGYNFGGFSAVESTAPRGVSRAESREVIRDEITLRGTVDAIDYTARTVRIRGDQGNIVTLDAPQSVVRFNQVKIGDIVTAAYSDRVSIRPKAPGEAGVDRIVAPTTTPTPGDLPGATIAAQRVTTVTLTAWDPATSVVSFTGPTGISYTRRLLDTADASVMEGLKVGDRVDITRTEALRISTQTGAAGRMTDPDAFRHRFSLSASWGLDTSFSGNMIEAATGQTTTGVPINLTDTTYDDVYGGFNVFKIGAGFRTAPRSEAVLNFVRSKEGPKEAVIVGTAGTGAVPLHVNFDDYSYWGFEAGQRFFFSRVRFTPYVGYLVGANRYGDIRGVFVDVPLNVTPGLAAQDGKFFEKSWAFSVGPTGGVLIGLGPFEVTAEMELRFMGGLSDVDWLVEEGLRDINTKSERWSLPVSFGARFRF